MIAGAHHIGLSVSDLDEMIAWYAEALGFALEVRFEVPTAGIRGAMLRRADRALYKVKRSGRNRVAHAEH